MPLRERRHASHAVRQSTRQHLPRGHNHPSTVDGVVHHFISIDRDDGLPVGHSHECSQAYWEPWPCGCHPIKGSGGTSPECEEYRRLEAAHEAVRRSSDKIHPEDFDLQELRHAKIEAAQLDVYRHRCICGAFDRPRRRAANVHPNGLQMGVPLAVFRSHPSFPGSLPEKWEGRWVSLNPAWPEMSVTSLVGCLRTPSVWVREDSSPDSKEYRDGLEGVIVYIKPTDEAAWLNRQLTVGILHELDLSELLVASIKKHLRKAYQARRTQVETKAKEVWYQLRPRK